MLIFVLDGSFKRVAVVDTYESFIWADRFIEFGDFELVVPLTEENRLLLKEDTWISINESRRVQCIRTVHETFAEDGKQIMKVTGESFEAFFKDRPLLFVWGSANNAGRWSLRGYSAYNAMNYVFTSGVQSVSADALPMTNARPDWFPPDTNERDIDTYNYAFEVSPVSEVLRGIGEPGGRSYRIGIEYQTGELHFNVYAGRDRTSRQTVDPAVIFSPELETLSNVTTLTSVKDHKNIARVYGPDRATFQGYKYYEAGLSSNLGKTGIARRVLLVEVDSYPDFSTTSSTAFIEWQVFMKMKGLEALEAYNRVVAVEGEVPPNSRYVYDTHYMIGDLVEVRNDRGEATYKRVVEQVIISDAEGDRSYPTLE